MSHHASVHASALDSETDLFGAPVRLPVTTARLELRGRLANDAQVRMQAHDHGHARPVLCIDLDMVGPGHHSVHVEQPFDAAHRFAADAAALTFKRGMWVSVETPLAGARWSLPNVASITPLQSPPKDH